MDKLGQDGGTDMTMVQEGPLPSRVRKPRPGERIAARLAAFVDTPPVVESVTPLAPGFFKMQRLRAAGSQA